MYLPQVIISSLLLLFVSACASTTPQCAQLNTASSLPTSAPAAAEKKTAAKAAATDGDMVKSYLHLRVPIFNELFNSTPVASVAGEAITLGQIVSQLTQSGSHGTSAGNDAGKKQYNKILERLIDTRLMYAEARATGLDELPEVKQSLGNLQTIALRRMVELKATEGLKPDPKMLETLYHLMVREWKIKSVIFEKPADALQMAAEAKQGKPFDTLAKAAVDAKKAKGGAPAQFLGKKNLLPAIHKAVQELKEGAVAGPIRLKDGYVVLQVEAFRHPENTKAKAQAKAQVLAVQRRQILNDYFEDLVKKFAKKNKRLLRRLDLGAKKPGYDALLKDQRVLVTVEGMPPITVADLALKIAQKYFHGVQPAIRDKKINGRIEPALKILLYKQVALRQAELTGLANDPAYKKYVAEKTLGLLVGLFINRVVASDLKLTEAEAKAHYEKNLPDYSYPEFFKMKTLGFTDLAAAKTAVASLRKGTDFKWVENHAQKLAPPEKRTVVRDDMTLSAKGLEPDLLSALAGAKVNDYRIYAAPSGLFYAVQVTAHIMPRPRKFSEVSKGIVKHLREKKLTDALREWTGKLRKAYEVQLYVQPEA